MTVQLALDHFTIDRIVFSGIAGGVDPDLHIGDVVIADRWGQYLETLFAREVEGGWVKPPFFDYPFPSFGMMFPRSVTVQRAGVDTPETRFWFPVDEALLARARDAVADVELSQCQGYGGCLEREPRIIIGGPGVSGGAFIDNAAFREYTFKTFGARVLVESAAVARGVCQRRAIYRHSQPSDLAGGGEGENRRGIFPLGGRQFGCQGAVAGDARIGGRLNKGRKVAYRCKSHHQPIHYGKSALVRRPSRAEFGVY